MDLKRYTDHPSHYESTSSLQLRRDIEPRVAENISIDHTRIAFRASNYISFAYFMKRDEQFTLAKTKHKAFNLR